jgi:hypothetical protein
MSLDCRPDALVVLEVLGIIGIVQEVLADQDLGVKDVVARDLFFGFLCFCGHLLRLLVLTMRNRMENETGKKKRAGSRFIYCNRSSPI